MDTGYLIMDLVDTFFYDSRILTSGLVSDDGYVFVFFRSGCTIPYEHLRTKITRLDCLISLKEHSEGLALYTSPNCVSTPSMSLSIKGSLKLLCQSKCNPDV